jgi:hypothetical protein
MARDHGRGVQISRSLLHLRRELDAVLVVLGAKQEIDRWAK